MSKKPCIALLGILLVLRATEIVAHRSQTSSNDAIRLSQCPIYGDARDANVRSLNLLKRRTAPPGISDIDSHVNLRAMLVPGDDKFRWNQSKAATIVGYVVDVKVGGVESVNCHTHDPLYRDTHIELALSASATAESELVIVEVTPQWRESELNAGIDWSTRHLRDQLLGRWVAVTGWLFFDSEHLSAAQNTAKPGAKVWRATAWEIHPVTKIDVLSKAPLN